MFWKSCLDCLQKRFFSIWKIDIFLHGLSSEICLPTLTGFSVTRTNFLLSDKEYKVIMTRKEIFLWKHCKKIYQSYFWNPTLLFWLFSLKQDGSFGNFSFRGKFVYCYQFCVLNNSHFGAFSIGDLKTTFFIWTELSHCFKEFKTTTFFLAWRFEWPW